MLTPKREKFVRNLADGMTQRKAYRNSFNAEKMKDSTVDRRASELFNNTVISKIADNHNVTPAQVILRWNLQKGVVVIPGSSNPNHIKENTDIYDFELSDDEMDKINGLDRNEKHDWY